MRNNFSALILAFALIVCTDIPAFAVATLEYVERSYNNRNVVSTTKTADNVNEILSTTTVWENSKWYYPYVRTTTITALQTKLTLRHSHFSKQ